MPLRQRLKTFMPMRMAYYAGKAGAAQYHQGKLRKFMQSGASGALPYELRGRYTFCNRQKQKEKLCMVLAGYKPELWHTVFDRLKAWLPEDTDVCIMTSGRLVPALMELCARNGWSYLSTRKNRLTRIQNLAIWLHPAAQYIYKLDEDIFLTQGCLERLYHTYCRAAAELRYEIAFAAPLIPVNGYGYVRVLEKCGLLEDWERYFGKAVYTDGKHHHAAIVEQGAAARYMWGEVQPILRDIDALAGKLAQAPEGYTICPIRFSIGAILFSRQSWLEWGLFPVDWTAGMGLDEEHIAHICMYHGKAAVVSENALAGHLAFGPQTQEMLAYYRENRSLFERDLP